MPLCNCIKAPMITFTFHSAGPKIIRKDQRFSLSGSNLTMHNIQVNPVHHPEMSSLNLFFLHPSFINIPSQPHPLFASEMAYFNEMIPQVKDEGDYVCEVETYTEPIHQVWVFYFSFGSRMQTHLLSFKIKPLFNTLFKKSFSLRTNF